LDHGFTHFNLRIRPILAYVVRRTGAEQPGRLWLTVEDALGAAVPAPVKRILRELQRTPQLTRPPAGTAEKA
jgi:A/G-specific adenine glycosylase